ncbi:MAG: hypothetical protein JW896_14015 [Deltaproteobacteria bacterium]|nr:hypothetical protein [Deltaproteobacteria bacterium]
MDRSKNLCLFCLMVLFLTFQVYPVMAAKPLPVIEMSNGYPSGAHFNLNIHGTSSCQTSEGGNSVFISEYGESTIQYVTNMKSSVTELIALDTCAEEFDGDPAKVQIPYESEGYFVFARIKGKPNNGYDALESSVILSPNLVTEACNDTDPANPDFPTYTECYDDTLLTLGLIVGTNVYEATDAGFVRFQDQDTKGKGKDKATDITSLFMFTGWVYDAILDSDLDGVIDTNDVPLTYDLNGNGMIDPDEFENWQLDQVDAGLATFYENEWILNIADLVVTDQTVSNDGAKLLKVRFYPVATTEYVSN